MVVLVVISGNELILGMSLIKMLQRIGPSIDPLGTPYKLDFALDMILSIFTKCVQSVNNVVRGLGSYDSQFNSIEHAEFITNCQLILTGTYHIRYNL